MRLMSFGVGLAAVAGGLVAQASRAPDGSIWTRSSMRFIDPPTLAFSNVVGAAQYRYEVMGDENVRLSLDPTAVPVVDLDAVWSKLPTPGNVTVVATAYGADGKLLKEAGRRNFWKKMPFVKGAYPPAKRDFATAARMVYDYVFALPSTKYLLEKGEPDPAYPLNGYPSKTLGFLINGALHYARMRPERAEETLAVARKAADYLIARSFPGDWPLAHFTRTYERGGEIGQFKGADDIVMTIYPAFAGRSLVNLHVRTGEKKYLDAAERIAATYIRLQGEDGVWPLKMNARTGEVVSPNRLVPSEPVDFFDELFAATGKEVYREASARAFAFFERGPLSNWNWEGQFEDIPPKPQPYANLSKHPAVWAECHLLTQAPVDAGKIELAKKLMAFAEDQFVEWTIPHFPQRPGFTVPDEAWRVRLGEYGRWTVPAALEQYACYLPIDASAARLIVGWTALYRATGDKVCLDKARAMAATMTRMQEPDGKIPTFWISGLKPGDSRRNNWVNCMLYSANALFDLATVGECRAKPTYAGPVRAEEVRVRDGIGHVMAKIRAGKEIAVAYLGGSITEMDGWRRLSREWLQREYPNARFREVQAAIGGTGSDLGVFRLEHDALCHQPDILFVEFATNDGGATPESIWENFDGIVRQTWKRNPETDIVFTYTITASMMKDYGAGLCPRAASAMEQLADYYGIPSVGFGPRVAAEVKAGRLVMSLGEVATAVPKETPNRDQVINEELKRKGKLLFAKDGVHPALPGHGFYLESIKAAWAAMKDLPPTDHAAKLAAPFYDARLEAAKMVPIRPEMLKGHWTKLAAHDRIQAHFSGRGGQMWRADTPGDRISFRFKGSECRIYDLLGPDCGRVWITVDGNRKPQPVGRFDEYCTYYRLAGFLVFRGQDGVHTVEIEVDKDQPDRTQIHRRTPDEDVTKRMYDGTKLFVCQVELVGDLLGD